MTKTSTDSTLGIVDGSKRSIETVSYLKEQSIQAKIHEKRPDPEITIPPGCSYPDRYDIITNLPGVGLIKIRPICKEDASGFETFFKELTPRSIYLRFFSFLRQLPPQMLERFTEIDYDREIALIALLQKDLSEKMVGDARVINTPPGDSAEFSILVSDALQGKGIGACLLRHCFAIARQRGFKHIHGAVLAENRQMLALGRKLRFTIRYVVGASEYELSKILD